MKFYVLFVFLTLSVPAHAQMQCFELFNVFETVRGEKEFMVKLGHKFSYEDKTYSFRFKAEIDNDGVLALDVELIHKKSGLRSYQHGGKLYAEMIQHFGLQNIKAITGVWAQGTNYDQFYNNLNNGMNAQDAAFNTWSGRQAAKFGFTKIESYEFVKFDVGELGDIAIPGHRLPFHVVFTRP